MGPFSRGYGIMHVPCEVIWLSRNSGHLFYWKMGLECLIKEAIEGYGHQAKLSKRVSVCLLQIFW
jgi:hypothetical protein